MRPSNCLPGLPWPWLCALLLAVLSWLGTLPAHAEPVRLTQATATEPGQPLPRSVTLPDAWEHTAPERRGEVSYRLQLPDDALQGPRPAVFIPRVGNVFRVLLNGHEVAAVGLPVQPLPNYSQDPQLLRLPRALLQPQGNTLDVVVIGEPRRDAGLSSVWVGDAGELEPLHDTALDLRVRGAWVLTSAGLTMGLLAVLVAWRTRQMVYGWFGLGNLIWAWRVTALSVRDPGVWAGLLHWAFELTYSLLVAAMLMFMLAMLQRDTVRARLGMAVYVGVSVLLSGANALWNLPLLRTLNLLLALLMVVAAAIYLLWMTWRTRSATAAVLGAAGVVGALFGLRDWMILRIAHDYEAVTWTRYVILLLMMVMAWRLVEDFARGLSAQHDQNRTLQATVQAKQAELEQSYEARRTLDRHQAAAAERDRLLRDMHDGLGGRLVSALALAHLPDQKIAEPGTLQDLRLTLDDCLTELRLTLDSLEAEQRSLGESLAEMRFRLEPSLRAAGIRLVWNVEDEALDTPLPPGDTLQVLRIVREACTNVIKHAQATVVWLTLRRDDQGIALSVLDNGMLQRSTPGRRHPVAPPSGKRGVASMRRRADALRGRIEIGPHPEGWQVALHFPLDSAAARPTGAGTA